MSKLFDIKRLSITLTNVFGTFTIRNYGEKSATITLSAPQKEANIVKTGAAGDSMTLKQYDISTKIISVSVLKDTPNDIRIKNLIAAEESGASIPTIISYNDENTGERYISVNGTLKEVTDLVRGPDQDQNIMYVFNMPEALHTPPTII
jgi:hypothetical protein